MLIDEIHNLYGAEVMEMIEKKDDIQKDVDTLKSTVHLTDLIVKGKDMELLLLQKEIQDKLNTFSRTSTKELPKTASKVIHFVPGMLDMGYIHDSDRPLLSQTRRTFSHQAEGDEFFDPSDCFDDAETQTDQSSLSAAASKATNTLMVVRCDSEVQTDDMLQCNGSFEADARRAMSYNGDVEDEDEQTARRRRRRREREKAQEGETQQGERQSRRAHRHHRSYDDD